jgi:hypothetical protein
VPAWFPGPHFAIPSQDKYGTDSGGGQAPQVGDDPEVTIALGGVTRFTPIFGTG